MRNHFLLALAISSSILVSGYGSQENTCHTADNCFYGQSTQLNGLVFKSSKRVNPNALQAAKLITSHMISSRPDLLKVLVNNKIYVSIISANEKLTDLPEYKNLNQLFPKVKDWNQRARGLGPTKKLPLVSSAEENLLCLEEDRYKGENIFLHEFSHALHFAIVKSDPKLQNQIKAAFENATKTGLWSNTYAATNEFEYFAETSQSWFDNNPTGPRGGDGIHNQYNSRVLLKAHDPQMAAVLQQVYGDGAWRLPGDRCTNVLLEL
jgi:hypothetical protein